MHWIVSNNMFNEEGFARLLAAFERMDVKHTLVKTIPFTNHLLPEICTCPCHYREMLHIEACCDSSQVPVTSNQIVVMGTYTLCNIARERGWLPGSFHDEVTFDYELQRKKWPGQMLNDDLRGGKLKKVPEELFAEPMFVRPVHDTKSFIGQIMDLEQFRAFRDGVLALRPEDQPTITGDTEVIIASKKEIWSETRVWMVYGKAVTASQYKFGTLKRYSSEVPPVILEYAEMLAQMWVPAPAFVVDIADTPEGLKAVEVNNFNAAGFYAADMQRLVGAIEAM